MAFTDDKTVKTGGFGHEDAVGGLSSEGEAVSLPGQSNPMWPADSQVVMHFFEVKSSQWAEEDYAWACHYRDAYGTYNFSQRVQEQINSYPGMHNTQGTTSPYTGKQDVDPWKKNAEQMGAAEMNYWNAAMDNPQAFMAGLQQKQKSFDYTQMFDSKDDFKKNAAALITECIPCFDRLFDGCQLLPDANLLEVHLLNILLRTDLIDKLLELLKNPGLNLDICELLKLLSHLCPQDLLAILALLSQYLAKLNLDFKFNLDLVIELVGPILSPFLDALSEWLDKWIQAILAPIICVVDHINMTMYLAQQMRLPLSEANVSLGFDAGIATPHFMGGDFNTPWSGHKDEKGNKLDDNTWSHGHSSGGLDFGFNGEGEGAYNPYAAGFVQNEAFDTPSSQLYNPTPPVPPLEEWDYSMAAAGDDDFEGKTGYDQLSKEEREAVFLDLQKRRKQKELDVALGTNAPPNRKPLADGSRWSSTDVPGSEKVGAGGSFSRGNVPPDQQSPSQEDGWKYLNADSIVEPIIQMRNILQGGIAYIQDWFDYVVQLLYDLLGTDFGWMKKKLGQTVLKSRIIQLIYMLIAIIDAMMNTDLRCGTDTNLNPAHMDYMIATAMNRLSPFKFIKRPDGTFEIIPPSATQAQRDPQDLMQEAKAAISVPEEKPPEQKAAESGIIIKDCLRKVTADDIAQVRQWIRDFERRSNAS